MVQIEAITTEGNIGGPNCGHIKSGVVAYRLGVTNPHSLSDRPTRLGQRIFGPIVATYPILIGPLDWVSAFGPVVATCMEGSSTKSHLCWEAYPDGGVSCGRSNQALRMTDFSQHLYAVGRTNHTHILRGTPTLPLLLA